MNPDDEDALTDLDEFASRKDYNSLADWWVAGDEYGRNYDYSMVGPIGYDE